MNLLSPALDSVISCFYVNLTSCFVYFVMSSQAHSAGKRPDASYIKLSVKGNIMEIILWSTCRSTTSFLASLN